MIFTLKLVDVNMLISTIKEFINASPQLKLEFSDEDFNRIVVRFLSHPKINERNVKSFISSLINVFKGFLKVSDLIGFEITIDNLNSENKNQYIQL